VPPTGASPSRDHAVLFYDDARDGVARVAQYVAEGLALGEAAVTVLRAAHTQALLETLRRRGPDPAVAVADGRLVLLDAPTTLQTLLVDGLPDRRLLATAVGTLLAGFAADGRPVRIAGEMVDLMWAEGNVTGALALESAWNELADTFDFALLCPYAATVLDTGRLESVGRLCALHTEVIPPPTYASGGDHASRPPVMTEIFVPAPEAVGATRRMVAGAITEWSLLHDKAPDDRLVADACLVASEISGNAVTHARSAFEVAVSCSDGAVRVSVSDTGPGAAEEHHGQTLALHGRGLTIVAEVADRWGCDVRPGGKVVWAELLARQPVAL
jgi:anti-sigma regulatory factor (Ser/Thr protein kinase)